MRIAIATLCYLAMGAYLIDLVLTINAGRPAPQWWVKVGLFFAFWVAAETARMWGKPSPHDSDRANERVEPHFGRGP